MALNGDFKFFQAIGGYVYVALFDVSGDYTLIFVLGAGAMALGALIAMFRQINRLDVATSDPCTYAIMHPEATQHNNNDPTDRSSAAPRLHERDTKRRCA